MALILIVVRAPFAGVSANGLTRILIYPHGYNA